MLLKSLIVLGGVMVLALAAGCNDRACIEFEDPPDECPSQTDAFAFLQDDCGNNAVESVESPGELEDGACCYDVTKHDEDSPPGFCSTAVGTGGFGASGGVGAQGGTGAIGGGGSGGATGDWSCLGFVPPDEPSGRPASAEIGVLEAYTADPFAGADVRVCSHGDAPCSDPFAEDQTNNFGFVTLGVPLTEPVFYEVTPVDSAPRTLHYEHRIPYVPTFALIVEPVFDGTVARWRAAVGAPSGPGFGDIFVREILDCSAIPASDVVLTLTSPTTSPFAYLLAGTVDFTLTQAVGGEGAALGVPVGPAEVAAYVASTGAPIGSFLVHVEGESLTTLRVEPLPSRFEQN